MNDKLQVLVANLGQGRIKFDEPLSHHVFSKIGGPAEYFYTATDQKELIKALDAARQLKIPFFVIGNGTKTLVPKRGFPGLTIKNRTGKIKIGGVKGKVGSAGLGIEEALVEVDSGVSLGGLNGFLNGQKLNPILSFSSLNSTVGGAIFLDPIFNELTKSIKIWEDGQIDDTTLYDLRTDQIVLSVVLKIKAQLQEKGGDAD